MKNFVPVVDFGMLMEVWLRSDIDPDQAKVYDFLGCRGNKYDFYGLSCQAIQAAIYDTQAGRVVE